MPTASLRACATAVCPDLVPQGERYCMAHRPTEALGWRQDATRIRGRKLQQLRMELWDRERHCRSCKQLLLPKQMIRDHIIPLAEGGTDDEANIQPLCVPCSDVKTKAEAKRGRR